VIFFFTKGLIDVTQTVYNGTTGNNYLDASAEGAKDIAVFRAAAGSDTCIGGAGADRFDGGAGADSMFGGGGNDAFFIARDNTTGGARDSIDGSTGTDLLNIVMSTYQVTDAVKAEIARLDAYLTGDITQHFVSDLFHVDMVNVETANIRLDGVIKTLAAVAPPANHAAGIAGTATGSVTEDGSLIASGTLVVTDADAGQAAFQSVGAAGLVQTYGSFSFNAATGAWGYTLNNAAANVQALTAAQTVTDTLHVTSLDGTAGQDITVSIHGADEAPPATTVTVGFEGLDATYFTAQGTPFSVSGFYFVDPARNTNVGSPTEGTTSGVAAYAGDNVLMTSNTDLVVTKDGGGSFSVDTIAVYNFNAPADAEIQGFQNGTEVRSVSIAADHAWHDMALNWTGVDTIKIHSGNGNIFLDSLVFGTASTAATIAGTATGSVTEDGGLVASGTLAVTDADAGQAAFQAVAAGSLAQTYGSFSFDAGTGAWGYTLANTAANVQALTAAQTVTDTLHVTSLDGTAGQDITVSIRGADEVATNHAATITGTYTGAVTENDTLAFYGHLTVTDADAGQAGLQTIAIADQAKTYGQFSVNFTNGNWSYTLNNNAANVQALTAAQTVTDTLHVTSRDGTAGQDITVSIHGADGAPVPVTIGFEAFAENTSAGGGAFSLQEAGFVFTNSYGYVVDAAFLTSQGKGVSANGGQALQTTLGTTITRADHGDFALDSLMNRLWAADSTVTIQGFHAGTKIYETTVSAASWHTDTLNWTGLDEVKIDTYGTNAIITDGWVFH
jgi:VCBS repeat-containing protein